MCSESDRYFFSSAAAASHVFSPIFLRPSLISINPDSAPAELSKRIHLTAFLPPRSYSQVLPASKSEQERAFSLAPLAATIASYNPLQYCTRPRIALNSSIILSPLHQSFHPSLAPLPESSGRSGSAIFAARATNVSLAPRTPKPTTLVLSRFGAFGGIRIVLPHQHTPLSSTSPTVLARYMSCDRRGANLH